MKNSIESCECSCYREGLKATNDYKYKSSGDNKLTKKGMTCDCEVIHQDKVQKAKQTMLDEGSLLKMADFYKALSDSTRIKIVDLLEKNELCVCDISSLIDMTKSAVSHQLKYLREMNLVKTRKKGKEIWYSLADEHVKQVFDISLTHVRELENE